MATKQKYKFIIYTYTNDFDYIVESKKTVYVERVCRYVAEEYAKKKYRIGYATRTHLEWVGF